MKSEGGQGIVPDIIGKDKLSGFLQKQNAYTLMKIQFTMPILFFGFSCASTLTSLTAIYSAKILDDYYRGDNSSLKAIDFKSDSPPPEFTDFIKTKLIYSQAVGQITKRFFSELFNIEYSDSQAFASWIDSYLPKIFQVKFAPGYGFNKTLNHLKSGLYIYYAVSAFDPLINILLYNIDPTDIVKGKINDLDEHFTLLIKKPLYIYVYNTTEFVYFLKDTLHSRLNHIYSDSKKLFEKINPFQSALPIEKPETDTDLEPHSSTNPNAAELGELGHQDNDNADTVLKPEL